MPACVSSVRCIGWLALLVLAWPFGLSAEPLQVAVVGGLQLSGVWPRLALRASQATGVELQTRAAAPKEQVVPLFRRQIAHGGPITLTHAEVTRYFMTIPEAAQLVLQAGAMGQGGDVFVLDMGEPVKIIDLARDMVVLSGLTVRDAAHPQGDIAVQITGLRPGEKLYEELLIGDNPQPTEHPRIMKAQENFLPWPQLQQQLAALHAMMQANDVPGISAQMQQLVNGYRAGPLVDNITLQQNTASELVHHP